MNKILSKRTLAENVIEYVIEAERVSRHAKPGQFIILRTNEDSERIPFTIADYDREKGTITILVQTVGFSTMELAKKEVGDYVHDFVGPLGNATNIDDAKRIVLIGGGIGSAVIYPQAKHLKKLGKKVDVILGARDYSLIMYEEEFRKTTDNLYIITDNGSSGEKGFVTDKLKSLVEGGKYYDLVFAVGPMIMMKMVSKLTKELDIKTIVSMNSIMVDGTGMCGGCRLLVDGKVKYACVDGPEFDGHKVDFDEALNRLKIYNNFEREHKCRMLEEHK